MKNGSRILVIKQSSFLEWFKKSLMKCYTLKACRFKHFLNWGWEDSSFERLS